MGQPLALIIEDDYKTANIFADVLQLAEFETEILTDGRTALARLKTARPAMVILDLHLPFISGSRLLSQIRTEGSLTETRVIVVTADAAMAELVQTEADLVLLKPIRPGQLRDLAFRLRPLDLTENY
jgi:DNA-binding response OmpR family regulator